LSHIIMTAFNAITPIIILIGLGYILKKKGFLTKDFISRGNKLVFRFCMPAMLFVNVYGIEDLQNVNWAVVLYCVFITAILFFIGFLCAVVTTKVPDRRGVLLQCTFRSNFAIIGLTMAAMLGGDPAVANAAVVSSVIIPLYNILGVISLTIFMDNGESGGKQLRSVFRNILTNPMIMGIAAGMLCVLIRMAQKSLLGSVVFSIKEDLTAVYTALNYLKSMTTPFALLILGGQFEFSAVRGCRKEICVGTLMRIVVAPLIGIGLAIVLSGTTSFFHCGPDMYPALIAIYGSPAAVTSAVMAGAMGNDEQLATQLVVWTSLLSIITLFAQICMLMYAGFL